MTLYCGIDLHSNNSVVAVLDEQDRTVYEKRLPNDIATITEVLCIYQSELAACVVESTYNWYWLVDGLMDAGFPVRLAHTSALSGMFGVRVKSPQLNSFYSDPNYSYFLPRDFKPHIIYCKILIYNIYI
jgi:hypothetical protein